MPSQQLPVNTNPTFTSITANNTDGVPAMDASNYRSGCLQITSIGGGGTIAIQHSLDGGTTWVSGQIRNFGSGGTGTTITTTGLFLFDILPGAQIRIRTTAYTSGTITGNVTLSSLSLPAIAGIVLTSAAGAQIGAGTLGSDTYSSGSQVLQVLAAGALFDGTNYNRQRGMTANTVLASAARTATISTDITNFNASAMAVFLNITAAPNTASTITVALRVKDSISGNYVTLLTSAAITGSVVTGSVPVTNRYALALGETVAANVAASVALGRTMNVLVTHSNGDSWTYSISADLGT